MIGLAQILVKYGDELEADLAFRGIDLRDHWRRGAGLTMRRLWVLIRGLPSDSCLHMAITDARQEDELAAKRAERMSRARKIEERAAHVRRIASASGADADLDGLRDDAELNQHGTDRPAD